MSHFVTGLIGGFAIAAPVGPIGMLCIRRSVTEGRLVGFMCGLGAAVADACYGSIAGFGLTTISQTLIAERVWIQLVGGLILMWIGIAAFRARPITADERLSATPSLHTAFASTLLLTLMNPMTILSFLAIFAGLGLGVSGGDALSAASLVAGVFLGSVAWWLIVSLAGGWLGARLEHGGLRIVNIVAGSIIMVLGAWQLGQAARFFGARLS